MSRVSIVILNWNGITHLRRFLPPLVRYSELPGTEIVVADNGSSDGSADYLEKEWPAIRLIRFSENLGFTGGYNKALEQLDSDLFLLLNSDVEVTEGWLPPLLSLMEQDKGTAACTPKIKDLNDRSRFEYAGASGGYLDRFGYPFCRGRLFDHLEADRGQYDDTADVFWGSGACLLVRADLFRKAGGFDERFFAHMEEIDLCWRLQRMGYRIKVVPASTVYHVGGGTLDRGNSRKTFLNFRNNLLLLHKNLAAGKRGRILFTRLLMDTLSGIRYFVQGDFKDSLAVLRAHLAYHRMKRLYRKEGPADPASIDNAEPAGIYPGSIVADFFLRKKKCFDQLDHPSWSGLR